MFTYTCTYKFKYFTYQFLSPAHVYERALTRWFRWMQYPFMLLEKSATTVDKDLVPP